MSELPEGLTPDVVEQFPCPNDPAAPRSTLPELGPRHHTLAIVAEFTVTKRNTIACRRQHQSRCSPNNCAVVRTLLGALRARRAGRGPRDPRERNSSIRATWDAGYQHPPDTDAVASTALSGCRGAESEWADALARSDRHRCSIETGLPRPGARPRRGRQDVGSEDTADGQGTVARRTFPDPAIGTPCCGARRRHGRVDAQSECREQLWDGEHGDFRDRVV